LKISIKSIISIIFFDCLICFLNPKFAMAQVVDSIHYNWTVYEYDKDNDEGGKECYIAAFAKNTDTSHTAPRNPHILITRYAKTRTEEVSVYAGYEYKINSNAYLLVDNQQYKLFTDQDAAWFRNDTDDKEVIQKMLTTDLIRFRSDSAIGTYAVDEYWMKGLTRAYARMKELCE
jgi:hypothetical protein